VNGRRHRSARVAVRIDGVLGRRGRLLRDFLDICRRGSTVLKNFAALLAADGLSKFLTLLTVGYLTRTIDSDAFGRIAFAESLLLTALLASDFGLEWYGVREIARAPEAVREKVIVLSSLRCALFLFVIGAFALLPLLLRQPADVRITTWLFGLSLLPNALLLEWVFCGLERMGIVAVGRLLRSGIYSLLVLTLVRDNDAAFAVPLIYFVATSAGTAGLLAVYIRNFGWPKLRWEPRTWRDVLGRSAPFAFNVLLLRGFYSTSMLVLGVYLSASAVAVFSAAYRPILVLIPLGGFLMTAVFPPLVRAGSSPSRDLRKHSSRLVTIVMICAAPVLVASLIHPEEVMRVLFGSQYTTGGHAFRILAPSVLLGWVSMVYATLLMATDKTARFMAGVVLGLSTGCVFSIALVPVRSIEGAAWSVIGGQLTCLVFLWVSLPAALRLIPWMEIVVVLVASVAMAAVMLAFPSSSLILSSVSGLLAYPVVLVFCLAVRPGANSLYGSLVRTASD
jgi:O-antigen/teichoic acid export membrane protein